jgi:hypothetical protein
MRFDADAQEITAVPLQDAVLCLECEAISNHSSSEDQCPVCGSRAVVSLLRALGGTIRSEENPPAKAQPGAIRYNLEFTVKAHELEAPDLHQVIRSISNLRRTNDHGAVKSLDIKPSSPEDQEPHEKPGEKPGPSHVA